jgi:hypothetical protein
LNLVYSHQRVGIQVADFIAGCFSGFLRGYPEGIRLFKTYIAPILRTGRNGQIVGYGVREIPKADLFRSELREELEPKVNERVKARLRSLFGWLARTYDTTADFTQRLISERFAYPALAI